MTTRPPLVTGDLVAGLGSMMRTDVLRTFEHVVASCGPIGAFRIGPQPAVVVASATGAREVLMHKARDYGKGWIQRRSLRPVLGDGLLISEGPRHDDHRAIVSPPLVAKQVPRYVSTIVEEAHRAIGTWSDGDRIDVLAEINRLAMDIVGQIVFDRRMSHEAGFDAAITEAFEWEMHAITRYVVPPPWLPTPRNRRLAAAKALVHQRIAALIEEARMEADAEHLLAHLLRGRRRDGTALEDRELLDEVVNLWGAAHETSADAQAWTVYLLGHHPKIAARLRAEVDDVVGDRPITAEDLSSLPYALQVFKESMRLYPPAAAVVRMTEHETTIDGYHLGKGTLVFVVPYLIHRDPDVYDHPDRFDPDRFAPGLERERPKLSFLPFGAGRHVCVGGHLALTEGQVLTATLAQLVRLELTSSAPVAPQLLINLRPSRPIEARVTHRHAAASVTNLNNPQPATVP